MDRSLFQVPKMDCAAEESLVRMQLDGMAAVGVVRQLVLGGVVDERETPELLGSGRLAARGNSNDRVGKAVAASVSVDRPAPTAYPWDMNITLRPDLEQLVERKLATGRYADQGAVIEEALELMRQQDDALAELQNALGEAHRRNARLDPEAAEALVGGAVREDRLQRR